MLASALHARCCSSIPFRIGSRPGRLSAKSQSSTTSLSVEVRCRRELQSDLSGYNRFASEKSLDGSDDDAPALLVDGKLLVVAVLKVFASKPPALWQIRLPHLEIDARGASAIAHSRAPDTEIVRSARRLNV